MDVSGVVACKKPTGTATVLVDDEGQNVIVVNPGANEELTPDHVREQFSRYRDAVVLISLEIPVRTAIAAAKAATLAGWTVILNAAPAQALPSQLLAMCDVLVANEREITQLGTDDVP